MVPSTALVWLSDIFFQNKHELNTMLFLTVFAIVFVGVAATELPANQTVDYIGKAQPTIFYCHPGNLVLDTKIKSLACSEQKLQIWPFCHILVVMNGHKWRFGHSGQSGTSENGPNGFPMPENLGMDTKIKSLALSKPKLHFVAIFGVLGAKFGPPSSFF